MQTFLIETLTPGTTYGFKVQARNQFGLSELSEEFQILCATVPEAPIQPTTTGVESDVIITWAEPFTNGSPITGYKVFIQAADTDFIQESVHCLSSEVLVAS